jgi:hypothetical protein
LGFSAGGDRAARFTGFKPHTYEAGINPGPPAHIFMEELARLIEKIVATIQRDVDNLFTKASGNVLQPEHQEALTRYLKILTDVKIAQKEKELEEKLKRAEEALNRGASS